MKTIQEKILGEIESLIKAYKMEPVISYAYANTGRVIAMDGGLEIHFAIVFAFNTDYATFTVLPDHGQSEKVEGKKYTKSMINYVGLEVETFLGDLERFLTDIVDSRDIEEVEPTDES